MKKSILAASVVLALGVSTSASAGYFAANQTYTVTVDDGSCFVFGDCTPGASTYTNNIQGGSFKFTTDATGDAFVVHSYNVGAYLNTAGGTFTTGGDATGSVVMGSGTVNAGDLDFNFDGRTGKAAVFAFLGTPAWNVDDNFARVPLASGTASSFTTGTAFNYTPDTASEVNTTMTGSTLVDNGDGTWSGVVVSVDNIGNAWGPFAGTPYSEMYNITISTSAVPVPAAAWLFGSGLLGLVGVARRRKAA